LDQIKEYEKVHLKKIVVGDEISVPIGFGINQVYYVREVRSLNGYEIDLKMSPNKEGEPTHITHYRHSGSSIVRKVVWKDFPEATD